MLLEVIVDAKIPTSPRTVADDTGKEECLQSILDFTVRGCDELLKSTKGHQQLPSQQYWRELRDTYLDVVGTDQSTIFWPRKNPEQPFSGLSVEYTEIKYSPEHGRGVYATQFIPAGTIVWNDNYDAIFPSQCAFKTFLTQISWEQGCDALQWCWGENPAESIDDYDSDGDYATDDGHSITLSSVIGCSLDEGSFFNHSPEGTNNIGNRDDTSRECIALRDIQPGEELTQDYESFEDKWYDWFDDLIETAWGEDFLSFEDDDEEEEDEDVAYPYHYSNLNLGREAKKTKKEL